MGNAAKLTADEAVKFLRGQFASLPSEGAAKRLRAFCRERYDYSAGSLKGRLAAVEVHINVEREIVRNLDLHDDKGVARRVLLQGRNWKPSRKAVAAFNEGKANITALRAVRRALLDER